MSNAAHAVRVARRTLDALLLVQIGFVLAVLVISRVLPALTGGVTFVVGGGSMDPAIPLGSAVLAAPVDATTLRPGDVVSLKVGPDHAVYTHRIVRLAQLPDGLYLETKGDANPAADPSLVPATAVVGRVSLSIPFAGYGVAMLGSAQGWLFLLALASALLAGAWLLEALEDERPAVRPAAGGHLAPAASHPARDNGREPGFIL